MVAVAVLGIVPLLHPAAALGAPSPIDSKRAEARRVADQLESQASRVVGLSRALERARGWSQQTDASVVGAEADLRATETKVAKSRTRLEEHAVDAYIRGGAAVMFSQFWRADSTVPARHEYLKLAAGADRTAIDQLKAAREDLQARRAHLASVRDEARAAMEAGEEKRPAAEKRLTQARRAVEKAAGLLKERESDGF